MDRVTREARAAGEEIIPEVAEGPGTILAESLRDRGWQQRDGRDSDPPEKKMGERTHWIATERERERERAKGWLDRRQMYDG